MSLIWGTGEYDVTGTEPRKPGDTLYITSLETPEPTVAVEIRGQFDPSEIDKAIAAASGPRPESTPLWVPALMAVGAVLYLEVLIAVFETAMRRLLP
jgi:hypothetical protein